MIVSYLGKARSIFSTTGLRTPAILAALSLLLCLLPIPAIVPALLLMIALCFVFPLSNVGYITRGVLSALLVASLNSIAGLVAWGFGFSLSNTLLLVFYNLVLLAVLSGFSKPITGLIRRQRKFLRIELVGVILALISMGVALKPLTQGADAVSLTRIVTFTDDNTAHLTIVKHVGNVGAYLYGNRSLINSGTPSGDLVYPQGWHLNTALAAQSFTRSAPSSETQLISYYLVACAWVGALAYLFTVLTLLLAQSMRFKVHIGAVIAGIVGIGFTFFINTVYPLFTWGAHPQIASFVLLLAVLMLIYDSVTASPGLRTLLTSISLVYIVGIGFFYYFQLPIALLFISIFLLVYYRDRILRFWKNPVILLFAALMLISLVPVVMYFKYLEISQAEVFGSSGGTLAFGNEFLLAVFLISMLYAFQRKSKALLWTGVLLLCSTLFMAAIMLYQYHALGSLQYYAYKASHAVIFLSALIMAVLFTEILSYLFSKRNSLLPLPILSAAVILALFSLSLTNRHPLFDIYVKTSPYGLSKSLADAVVAASQSPDASRTLAIGSCQSYFDVRAMNMIIALSGETTSYQTKIALVQYDSKQEQKVFSLIRDYRSSAGRPLTIISSDTATMSALKEYMGSAANGLKIIDISQGNTNASCPLRLS